MFEPENYFENHDFLEILNKYEQAVKSGQAIYMDVDDLADIADYYFRQERYAERNEVVDRIIAQEPNSIVALTYRIQDALDAGDTTLAREYLDCFVDQDVPEYLYAKAEILIAENNVEAADELFRSEFREMPPEEIQDYVLDVANIYIDNGLNEKALEWMMRARHENTDDFKELMARALFGVGKYKESEHIFDELLDKHPFQKRYWNALASAQFMREDFSASVTSSEYAIAIDPQDPDSILSKANGLFQLNNIEEALAYYERYSELVPDDEYGFLHQGTCLVSLGRSQEAIERLRHAEQIAPADSAELLEIYQELAFAYADQNMPESALFYLDKTDDLDCDHIDMQVVRGHILLSCQRQEEAEKAFRKAIKDSACAPRTIMRVIVSLYDNRLTESAYQMFQMFFKIVDEDWNEGYAYMALCCWKLRKTDEFMAYLKNACIKNPREAKSVLAQLFPEDLDVADYYKYMTEKLKNT